MLRSGGSDAEVAQAVRRAVWGKRAGHGIDDPTLLQPRATTTTGTGDFHHPRRSMSAIGG